MKRYAHLKYKLTQKVALHGCSCKLPRRELYELLQATGLNKVTDERVLTGVGDDAGVVKVSRNMAVVQHLDFFTPLIDDPYIQGQIAACNSASDVFSKGATDVIGVLAIIGSPVDMPDHVLKKMVKGFHDHCSTIKAPIVGGHTLLCPWPIIGGSVVAVTRISNIVYNSGAKPGDTLFLTKPLGTQPAMGILRVPLEDQEATTKGIPHSIISAAIDKAIEIMTTPNKDAAEAMLEVGVNAATDVTGFGFLGQSEIMAKRSCVDIVLHTMPVIRGTIELSNALGYGLEEGVSAETSGGLLISVRREKADLLVSSLERRKIPVCEVGLVKKGTGNAHLLKKPKIIEV
ncbi:MAG TPA: selenide, water dikinase SelD [Candidatus Bathyarchaeia archaeon]